VRAGGVAVTIQVDDEASLDETARLGLFRVTQEALTNVVRHAGAAKVAIVGRREGAVYRFAVTDDGRGYDPAAVRAGAIGLAGMRERAALLGGECEIASAPKAGVVVTVRLPIRDGVNDHSGDTGQNEHPAD